MAWFKDGDWNKGLDDPEIFKPFSPLREVFEPAEWREGKEDDGFSWGDSHSWGWGKSNDDKGWW